MTITLQSALRVLRENEPELRSRGVLHAAVFGSVARGDADSASDLDLMVELEPHKPCGVFEFVRLQLDMSELLGIRVDLAERDALKPLVRDAALKDAVDAF